VGEKEKETETDIRWDPLGRARGYLAEPDSSLARFLPSFAGTLLATQGILVRGFSDSWGSEIFVILRDLTESSSLDLIGSILLRYSSRFW